MSNFPSDLLRRSQEHDKAADQLFLGSFPDARDKEQAVAIVAKVTANVYRVLAEYLAYEKGTQTQSDTDTRRQALLERSNAIRIAHVNAVESGDWTEYDHLAFGGKPDGGTGGPGD